jgi:hypothetical protein
VELIRLLFAFHKGPGSNLFSDRLTIVVSHGGAFHFRRYFVPSRHFFCWEHFSTALIITILIVVTRTICVYYTCYWYWKVKLLCRSQWPRGVRRGPAAARLLGLWFRIPPGAWMCVSFECCVLSGRGLCVGLVPRPEESYRLWCVWVCDREASKMRRPRPQRGCRAIGKKEKKIVFVLNLAWRCNWR